MSEASLRCLRWRVSTTISSPGPKPTVGTPNMPQQATPSGADGQAHRELAQHLVAVLVDHRRGALFASLPKPVYA